MQHLRQKNPNLFMKVMIHMGYEKGKNFNIKVL